jgi:hypothetical protein
MAMCRRTTARSAWITSEDMEQSFDNANNLEAISSVNGGSYAFVYDEINRIKKQTWTFGGRSYVTDYVYL